MDVRENRLEAQNVPVTATAERGRGEIVRKIFLGMLYAFWGYVLGATTLPFGAAPFGVALLAAADRRAFFIFGGLCLWSLSSGEAVIWLSVFAAVLLVRILVRLLLDLPARFRARRREEITVGEIGPYLLREHIALRMATAAVAAFAVGLIRLRLGGYLFYDLYGTILSVVAAPVATLLLYGFFEGDREGWQYQLGFLSLGAILCYGGATWRFYGISLAVFGALFASLYVSRRRGMVAGMVTGTLFGLATAPALSPAFAFGALAGGLLFPFSVGLGCFGAFGASLAWGYYVEGLEILNGTFAALLGASALFSVWERLFLREEARTRAEPTEKSVEVMKANEFGAEDRVRLDDSIGRIRALSQGFRELGEVFDRLARSERRPEESDLRQICDRAFDACCTSCPTKEDCWGDHFYLTTAEIGEICSVLHKKGRVSRADMSGGLPDRCGRLSDILEEIHHNAAGYEAQLLASDRTEIFSEDFSMISEILTSVLSSADREYERDRDTAARLTEELVKRGISVSACVLGSHQKRALIRGAREVLIRQRDTIRLVAGECLGVPMTEKRWDEEEGLLELIEDAHLCAKIAVRSICAVGEEEFCGDTVLTLRGEDGMLYALISDGMGSGKEASNTSKTAAIFLKKLLLAGAGCEETLRLLNVFLRNRGSGALRECSATVDLLALDLLAGRASFYKSGAAPTYVVRDGGVFKLRSRTLPMGIIRDPDVKKICLELGMGDLLVMVSDGVTQGREECPRLYDLIRSHADHTDPERLADLLMKYAKDEGSTDDISVLVLRVEAA